MNEKIINKFITCEKITCEKKENSIDLAVNSQLTRYSDITEVMPREFILLQGTGCRWRKCRFCNYYEDISAFPYEVNKGVIGMVSGKHGVLDVINSGSCTELDEKTVVLLQKTVKNLNIKTLWFESHFMYRHKLNEFAELFPDTDVKFRCGAETFDGELRESWQKGIPKEVTAEELAKYFKGVCLLVGIRGQSFESVKRDVLLAGKYFEYFSVNVFNENSTPLKRDEDLINRFKIEIMPQIIADNRGEVLLNNTDLGVG